MATVAKFATAQKGKRIRGALIMFTLVIVIANVGGFIFIFTTRKSNKEVK